MWSRGSGGVVVAVLAAVILLVVSNFDSTGRTSELLRAAAFVVFVLGLVVRAVLSRSAKSRTE